MGRYWKNEAYIVLLGLLPLPLSLFNPYLAKFAIDEGYLHKDLKRFILLSLICGCIFIINHTINSIKSYLEQCLKLHVGFDMSKDFFGHTQRLPLSFFKDRSGGEYVFKISSDVEHVSSFICSALPQTLTLLPRLIFIFIIVFYLNWRIALFAMMLMPVNYLLFYFLSAWFQKAARKMAEVSQELYEKLYETFSRIYLIKAMGSENKEIVKIENNLQQKINIGIKIAGISGLSGFTGELVNKIVVGLIALYAVYHVFNLTITWGSFAAIMIYLTQLQEVIKSIAGLYEGWVLNLVSGKRLKEILEQKAAVDKASCLENVSMTRPEIVFERVFFEYKSGYPIFKDLSFSIAAGAKIAIVGASGCGKTTLLNMIMSLYDINEGRVLIGGYDIQRLKTETLKSKIGVALQEPFLWNDSILNNILYGTDNGSLTDAVWAMELTGARTFIQGFSKGHDSIIGESGCKISEGQKQRIAIARAIVKRPEILILDEATSSLDPESEEIIIDNIKRELKDSTIIIVSHRISAVHKMDTVYFLQGPSGMAIGRHEEFLAKNSGYLDLFKGQAAVEELNPSFERA